MSSQESNKVNKINKLIKNAKHLSKKMQDKQGMKPNNTFKANLNHNLYKEFWEVTIKSLTSACKSLDLSLYLLDVKYIPFFCHLGQM